MDRRLIEFEYTKDESGRMDASYIYLKPLSELAEGEAVGQVTFDGSQVSSDLPFRGELILDLDKDGNILGIEILGDVIPSNLKS